MVISPNLSRIFRTRVSVHYTWIIAIILITAAVVTQFSTSYPLWQRITLGVVASLIYFLALIVRQLALNLIATRKGIKVKNYTLFIFGEVPQIDKETTSPALEMLLAMFGWLANLILAGIFYAVYVILASTGSITGHILMQWLAFIYLMLALFHLIPAFPLDGGRALRALLWKLSNNYERTTKITSWIGWGAGLALAAGGVAILVTSQQWFAGLLLIFPGLALQGAATRSRRQLKMDTPSTDS